MHRIVLAFIALLFITTSCTKEPVISVSLKMDLTGCTDTANVFLYRYENGYVPFDTARKEKSGILFFTRSVEHADFFLLKLPNGQQLPMVLNATTTLLRADAANLTETAVYAQNDASEQIRQSLLLSNEFGLKVNQIACQLTDTLQPPPLAVLKDSLIQYIDTLKKPFADRLEQIIREKPSLGNLPAILQRSGNHPIFNITDNRQLFIDVDTFLIRHYAHLLPVRQFHYHLDSVLNQVDSVLTVNVGDQLPDAGLPNAWGEKISLFKFRGKPLLVIVWDSENPFCQQLIPQTKQIIKDYKSKNLDVYMVSVDSLKNKWSTAIDIHRLACWHVSDLKGKQSPVMQKWGIRSLPSVFLLNENGTIVEKNIDGKQLIESIEKMVVTKKPTP